MWMDLPSFLVREIRRPFELQNAFHEILVAGNWTWRRICGTVCLITWRLIFFFLNWFLSLLPLPFSFLVYWPICNFLGDRGKIASAHSVSVLATTRQYRYIYFISGLRCSCPRKDQLQRWQIALTIKRTHPVDGRAGYNHRAACLEKRRKTWTIRAPRVTARLRLMGFPRLEIRSSLATRSVPGTIDSFLNRVATAVEHLFYVACSGRGRRCVNARPSTLITTIMISRLQKNLRGIVSWNFARVENSSFLRVLRENALINEKHLKKSIWSIWKRMRWECTRWSRIINEVGE